MRGGGGRGRTFRGREGIGRRGRRRGIELLRERKNVGKGYYCVVFTINVAVNVAVMSRQMFLRFSHLLRIVTVMSPD